MIMLFNPSLIQRGVLFLCWVLLSALPLLAADVTYTLPVETITSTSYLTHESPTSVVNLTDQDRIASTWPVLLSRMTGVVVNQYGQEGQPMVVSVRGSMSNQVLVFVDGVPLNVADSGVDLSVLPFSQIGKIELFSGLRYASLSGLQAIGGRVNVTTRDSDRPLTVTSVRAGSYETYKGSVFSKTKAGDFPVVVTAERFFSAGTYRFLNNRGTEFNTNDDFWDTRLNNQVDQTSGRVQLQVPDLGSSLSFDFLDLKRGTPGLLTSPAKSAYYTQKNWDLGYQSDCYNLLGLGEQSTNQVYLRQKNDVFADPNGEFHSGFSSFSLYNTEVFGLQSEWGLATGDWYWKTFAKGEWARVSDTTSVLGARRTTEAGIGVSVPFGSASLDSGLMMGRYSDTGTSYAYYTTLSWPVGGDVSILTGYRTGFRQPSFSEKYATIGLFKPNPSLRPESVEEWEFGASWNALKATYFKRKIRDLIETTIVSGTWIQPFNIGRVDADGLELSGTSTWGPVDFTASTSLLRMLDRTGLSNRDGYPVVGRPEWVSFVRADWSPAPSWRLFSEYSFIDGNYTTVGTAPKVESGDDIGSLFQYFLQIIGVLPRPDRGGVLLPPRHSVNVGVEVDMDSQWMLGLTVKNLLDAQIVDRYGFPLPGREMSVSSVWVF